MIIPVSWWSTSDSAWATPQNQSWTTSETTHTSGGAADLWGRTPIDTDFSDANFSVYVEGQPSAGDTAQLDHIQVKVYYTEAASGTNMEVNIADAWKTVDTVQINIGDVWKDVTKVEINIGDAWKEVFS